ncbi:hypothetical protein [Chamaesiphon minutus]|uniref:Uncharacterized protein n=1 Tax=Chamaesiphon minutus (strain ATCC 27169 / PCC 6605) TaxID=1173020 RepID=K9UHJ4_CHAP6|nr:hypothetical protein [Chamaesiphon minutus]AFY93679.1 hypothetical protein Cha6605_2635 [Chamaesiphon minutus PCC 6605]
MSLLLSASDFHRRQYHKAIANMTLRLVCTATFLTLGNIAPGFAQERIVPTGIATGDCVAPIISTSKTTAHQRFDRQYCTKNNPGNSQKVRACQQNLAEQKQVTFFTDRCGSKGIYFIGINGIEYQLKRTGGSLNRPPYLTGSFVGKGIRVNVKEIRSIKKTNADGIEGGELEVLVTIIQGKNTEQITGILSYGP